jgi:acetyltransferase-like isoleucine patch superfamily enzyme
MKSHGTGAFSPADLGRVGRDVVFEPGVLIFHPQNVEIDDDVYIGHYTILKAYHVNRLVIGAGTWIGQQCFLHSAGGLSIGRNVGIGPGVKIVTSSHRLDETDRPILHSTIDFAAVTIEDGCDVGVGAILLPGVRIGVGAQVAAGAVVAGDVDDYSVVGGVPARLIRRRR